MYRNCNACALESISHICLMTLGTEIGRSCLLFAAIARLTARRNCARRVYGFISRVSSNLRFLSPRWDSRGDVPSYRENSLSSSSRRLVSGSSKFTFREFYYVTFWVEPPHFNISSITQEYCKKSGMAPWFILDLRYIRFRTIMAFGISVKRDLSWSRQHQNTVSSWTDRREARKAFLPSPCLAVCWFVA